MYVCKQRHVLCCVSATCKPSGYEPSRISMVRWTRESKCKVRIRRSFQFNLFRWESGEKGSLSLQNIIPYDVFPYIPVLSYTIALCGASMCGDPAIACNCMAWWATCKGTLTHDQARFLVWKSWLWWVKFISTQSSDSISTDFPFSSARKKLTT